MNNKPVGWIMLHRKLSDKAYYRKDSEKVHLWIHLLLSANREEREEQLGGKPIICKPGQFTTGRKQLSMETGISESKIERILTYFEKNEQQIEQRKTNTNRLITVLNWHEYQACEQQIEQQVNNDRTTSEQRLDTLQEYKEVKKKRTYSTQASSLFDDIVVLFDENCRPTPAQKEKWVALCEKLLKEYSAEEIKQVVKKARMDDFWRVNFQSLLKLDKTNKEGIKYFIVFKNRFTTKRVNDYDITDADFKRD